MKQEAVEVAVSIEPLNNLRSHRGFSHCSCTTGLALWVWRPLVYGSTVTRWLLQLQMSLPHTKSGSPVWEGRYRCYWSSPPLPMHFTTLPNSSLALRLFPKTTEDCFVQKPQVRSAKIFIPRVFLVRLQSPEVVVQRLPGALPSL